MTSCVVFLNGRMIGYVGKAAKLGWSSWTKLSVGCHHCEGGVLVSADVKEVELIDCGSNARSKEEHIALKPCDGFRWIFVSRSGFRHVYSMCSIRMSYVRLYKDIRW
jgi:hypothetical protein